MTRWLSAAAIAIPLLAAAPTQFGPAHAYSGIYTTHFEFSEFDGCWLTFTPPALARYKAIIPESFDRQRIRLEFIGRGTPRLRNFKRGKHGYGHMAMYPCHILVIELGSAKLLPANAY